MGLSPGLINTVRQRQRRRAEEAAAEQQEIKNQQNQERIKAIQDQTKTDQDRVKLNRDIFKAEQDLEFAKAQQALAESKSTAISKALIGESTKIGEQFEDLNLFPDPSSGQAPGATPSSSQFFDPNIGEFEVPQDILENAEQFLNQQEFQDLQEVEKQSIAEEQGRILKQDEQGKILSAENRLTHQDKLNQQKQDSELRRGDITFDLQARGINEPSLVADDVDSIFKLQRNKKDINSKIRQDTVQGQLIEKGITDFNNIKGHQEYVSAVGTINGLFGKAIEFVAKKWDLPLDQIMGASATPASTISRLLQFGKGNLQRIAGFPEGKRLLDEIEAMKGFISRTTGGDKGSRLSDLDLKLAGNSIPDLDTTLEDDLRRINNLQKIYEENFHKFYASLNTEQRQYQIDTLNLPFKADPVFKKSSRFSLKDPRIIQLAKEDKVTPAAIIKQLEAESAR